MRKAFKKNSNVTNNHRQSFSSHGDREICRFTTASFPDQRVFTKETSMKHIKKHISDLSKSEINQQDIFGRTLLHIAASTGEYDILRTLLDHPHINTTIVDYENGWTALHRACYNGYILCAVMLLEANYDCISITDNDSQRPFDLLPNNLFQSKTKLEDHWNPSVGGSHLLTFGSNTNSILGFGDADNRLFPQVVDLKRDTKQYSKELSRRKRNTISIHENDSSDDESNAEDVLSNVVFNSNSPRLKFQSVRVKDLQISKLHSVILTTDPTNNLQICGLATGGRLGLGDEVKTTQYKFRVVPRFSSSKVLAVALGLNHTLAVTSTGIFSWGLNQYGQLGTSIETNSLNFPRKINSDFGLDKVIGVAASQYHSVAFTESSLYFWGKNIGQMGILPTHDAWRLKKNKNLECENGGIIIEAPQLFQNIAAPVKSAVACDIATVCLLQNSSVWVFINGGHFRVQYPFKTMNVSNFDSFRPSSIDFTRKIVHISCSPNGHVCSIDDHGAVYVFSLAAHYVEPSKLDESIKASHIAKNLKIHKVWHPRSSIEAACNADISDDGSVILCTIQGSVWKKFLKGKTNSFQGSRIEISMSMPGMKKCHYERVPHLNKVYQVRCDKLFSSFGVIRDDAGLKFLTLEETSISDDLANLLPFQNPPELHMQAKYLAIFPKRRGRYFFNRQKKQKDCEDSLLTSSLPFTVERTPLTTKMLTESDTLMKFSVDPVGQLLSPINYNNQNCKYNMVIYCESSNVVIPIHREILLSRVKSMIDLVSGQISVLEGLMNLQITYDNTSYSDYPYGKITFSNDVHELAVRVLIYYIYTGKYIRPWDDFVPPDGMRKNRPYEDFNRILTTLGITNVKSYHNSSATNLGRDIFQFIQTPEYHSFLEDSVTIHLMDGKIKVNKDIFSSRSAYFATALSERWNNSTAIYLTHIEMCVFEVIIRYVYCDEHVTSFDDLNQNFGSQKIFEDFVLKVMEAANELTLTKLFQACEVVLADLGMLYF